MVSGPHYDAWFQCISGCSERYELTEIIYRCPACGDLLEVVHDIDALKQRSAHDWRHLFQSRAHSNQWPYGSGVWGKKELVCPVVDNDNVVSMYEGNTNLFWAERLGREIGVPNLWIKQCGNTHTGSFKDLGMTVLVSMVNEMRRRGRHIRAVACASTGDTSAALAAYAAAADIPAIVFLPKGKISYAQLVQPLANGALTLALDTDFDGCMRIVQEVCAQETIYLANSMNSLRVEGQKTISIEIVQQDDWQVPDWIVIPGGNLGNVSALGKGFELMLALGLINRRPRIACAQAHNANPLYRSYLKNFESFEPMEAKPTLASAIRIGNPVSVKKAIRILQEFDGVVVDATEQELADASARADRTGLFNCPHTGVALAGLFKLIEDGTIRREHRVVVISTAHGLKFADSKAEYHEGKLPGIEGHFRNVPVELPPEVDAVRRVIDERCA
jgi:threonine synthase